MCTTMGETGADYLAVNAGLGQTVTRMAMTALLIAALIVQCASAATPLGFTGSQWCW